MLELLLSAVSKVTQLLEIRTKRRKEIFNRLIRPTHEQLSKVHADYIQSFELLRVKAHALDKVLKEIIISERDMYGIDGLRHARHFYFEKNREELMELHNLVRAQRVFMEMIRSELMTSMKTYVAKMQYREEKRYLQAVEDYFPVSINEKGRKKVFSIGNLARTVQSSILTDYRALEMGIRAAREVIRERFSAAQKANFSEEARPRPELSSESLLLVEDDESKDYVEEMSITRIMWNLDQERVSINVIHEINLIIINRKRRWKIICERYAEVNVKHLEIG